ncbi:MAG: hypothetical protein IPK13_08880 [Deltaproteobacteria bacterium]|nr:hypothetical protein [Deltaproteobacteria bacterium]
MPSQADLWLGSGRSFSAAEKVGPNRFRRMQDDAWSMTSLDLDRVRVEDHRVLAMRPGLALVRVERRVGASEESCVVQIEVMPESIFAQRVELFAPGPGAGFGQDRLPDVVRGAPRGAGAYAGSTDVVSLGLAGFMVLGFDGVVGYDGPGADLVVFENLFLPQGIGDPYFEPAQISVGLVSSVSMLSFPCEGSRPPFDGCAGLSPVYADGTSVSDFTNPRAAGGDAFDLSALLSEASAVNGNKDAYDSANGNADDNNDNNDNDNDNDNDNADDTEASARADVVHEARASYSDALFDRIALQDVSDLAGRPAVGTTSGFDLDAVALIHAVPAETRAIEMRWAAGSEIQLAVGDEVLLPDVQAIGRRDGPTRGLEVGFTVSGAAVSFGAGGLTLVASQAGTATVTAQAGPWTTTTRIEVR